jgi:thioesterase domain-containing protein
MRIDVCQPVYGIQSQALLAGRPALLKMEDMAAYYIEEMRKIQPHGPYRLLGYSFGGTVVLEMAHQLRAAGEPVAPIAMLDSHSHEFEQQRRKELPVQALVDRRMKRIIGNTQKLTMMDRLKYFTEKAHTRSIRIASTLAPKLGIDKLPSFMKSAWDINHAAINRYEVKPFDGKLLLFRAEEQEFSGGPVDMGWGKVFTQGVEVHAISGDHERIFLEPAIDSLATSIHAALRRA